MKKTLSAVAIFCFFSLILVSTAFSETVSLPMTGRHLKLYNNSPSGDNNLMCGSYARGPSITYCDETIFKADVSSLANMNINSVEFRFTVSSVHTDNNSCIANLYEQNKGPFSTSATYSNYPNSSWNNNLGEKGLGPANQSTDCVISTTPLKDLVQAWVKNNKPNNGLVLVGNFGFYLWYWTISSAVLYIDYTIPNDPPVANNVACAGTPELRQILTGSYTYSDAENNPEGASTFKWYRANDSSGSGATVISGATLLEYILKDADYQKYVCFEVTPVATSGTKTGTPVKSAYLGPVAGALFVYPNVAGSGNNVKIDGKLTVNSATPSVNGVVNIKGGVGNFLELQNTNGGSWLFHNGDTEDWLGFGYMKDYFMLDDIIAINKNGLVGIGTHENLDAKLCVDGTIKAKDITLENAITAEQFKVGKWIIESPPDFVFAPDYNLRSLKAVKDFIDQNSHLPDVKSAREIKEEGIDLVEMNMTLLKKVEELFLYTIEQGAKIEKLEKELEELKK